MLMLLFRKKSLTTNEEREFAWDVPEGYWQVVITKEGYEKAYSEWMEVPPERTGVAIPMISIKTPVIENAIVNAGSATITFSQYMDSSTISKIKFTNSNKTEIEYTLSYDKSQKDKDGNVFAKTYKFVFSTNQTVDSVITIDLPKTVLNYAGKEFTADSIEVTVSKPSEIISDDSIELAYEETKNVQIEIVNYKKDIVLGCSSSSETGLGVALSELNSEGKAQLSLNGVIPGTYKVDIFIEGTEIKNEIIVIVKEADIIIEPKDEIDDNCIVLMCNKWLWTY